MEEQEQQGPLDAVGEAAGCVLILLCVFGGSYLIPIIGGVILIQTAKEHNEELSVEMHSIEGVVSNVEVVVKDPPITDLEVDSEEEETKPRVQFSYRVGPGHQQVTKVDFEDGRFMEFNGVSEKPMTTGEYHVITYNGLKEIISFEVTTGLPKATMLEETGDVH